MWKDGAEIERTPLDGKPLAVAQAGGVTVSTYIDTKLNNEFIDADVDMLSYAYTATPSAGEVFITPDAPQILDIWKGDAVLRDDSIDQNAWLFEDPGQFSPVFLVIELSNEGNQTAQVTSAWFDLAESITDYQPYVVHLRIVQHRVRPRLRLPEFRLGRGLRRDAHLRLRRRERPGRRRTSSPTSARSTTTCRRPRSTA